jgi:phosphoribosylanthranilate isomerase
MSTVATPRVKLCGLRRPQDVEAANEARPDYVGFVVDFPRSRRNIPASELAVLSRLVRPEIRRVGVFVDEPIEEIAKLFESGTIDVAQLHGSEDEAYLSRLRATCGVPVIQAFRMRDAEDVERAMASTAELVLLDNGQGTGHTFNWSLARDVRRPFMLAGGLGPKNVAQAIRAAHPWGVDMSGGVETEGTKDPIKMRAAVVAAKGAI